MQATSEAWNWLNIGVIGSVAGLGTLGVAGIILLIFFSKPTPKKRIAVPTPPRIAQLPISQTHSIEASITTKSPSTHIQPTSETSSSLVPSSTAKTDMLIAIGARTLLQDVNRFLLKEIGTIKEVPNELSLEWPALASNSNYSIHIQLLNHQQVLVNGKTFPATHDGVKIGIATAIKEIGNSNRQ
jgi:hypothetical protein